MDCYPARRVFYSFIYIFEEFGFTVDDIPESDEKRADIQQYLAGLLVS